MLANTVGGAVALTLAAGEDPFLALILLPVLGVVAFDVDGFVIGAVAFAVGLVFYGAITGGVLVWLLRQPAAKEIGPRPARRITTRWGVPSTTQVTWRSRRFGRARSVN